MGNTFAVKSSERGIAKTLTVTLQEKQELSKPTYTGMTEKKSSFYALGSFRAWLGLTLAQQHLLIVLMFSSSPLETLSRPFIEVARLLQLQHPKKVTGGHLGGKLINAEPC